ncbi:L,D-transpeptidase family protein [Acinetobacter sp. NIPH 2100]|uniref:L,D-transpeptidase family protein n=1 Tax=Acinetobacter sp. NIPH 2100 TaxID=1217708 RepID=UPI0002CE0FE0|nr:L,D-transpeptidase family protein [Acinetobacter sp. NIPH 2100]ENX41532.1 hypothetical protein F887_01928 [Acinetobacter sp. NIPH 2100]
MRSFVLLVISVFVSVFVSAGEINLIKVSKSEKKLYLISDGKVEKEFNVVFGKNPKGHKQQEGDFKTPEGKYTIDWKNPNSKYYLGLHISYPNEADKQSAAKRKVKPGGDIMIHGQKNGFGGLSFISQRFNWTDGCIALTNKDMKTVYDSVKKDTPIEISP